MNKKLIWSYYSKGVNILIPKQRGTGYIKYPIYHNVNALSQWIDDNIKWKGSQIATVSGLDGYVNFKLDYVEHSDIPEIEKQIVQPLAMEYFGYGYEYVEHDKFMNMVIENNKK